MWFLMTNRGDNGLNMLFHADISLARIFFLSRKSLDSQCMNYFSGLLAVHEFFFYRAILPFFDFFFLLRPPPLPPHLPAKKTTKTKTILFAVMVRL